MARRLHIKPLTADSPELMAVKMPTDKIVIKIERKPEPPGFVCSLCDEPRERWQSAYESTDVRLCSICRLKTPMGSRYWNCGLTWNDLNTIFIARAVAGELRSEIDGRKRTITRRETGLGDSDRRADRRSKKSSRWPNLGARSPRKSRTRTTDIEGRALRGDGSEIS